VVLVAASRVAASRAGRESLICCAEVVHDFDLGRRLVAAGWTWRVVIGLHERLGSPVVGHTPPADDLTRARVSACPVGTGRTRLEREGCVPRPSFVFAACSSLQTRRVVHILFLFFVFSVRCFSLFWTCERRKHASLCSV
jgi:hypothetical protein